MEKVLVGVRVSSKKPKVQTRGLLVDFDGTLVDSVAPLKRLFLNFLAAQGLKGGADEFDRLNGMAIREVLPLLREKYALPWSDEELWLRYRDHIHQIYCNEVKPFAGAREFLEGAAQRGLRVAIVTSSMAEFVKSFLVKYDLDRLVDCVITSERVVRSKPDPAIYQLAVAELGFLPSEFIAIEDSVSGLKSALAAGVPTLALLRERMTLNLPSGVMATVTTFEEVLEFSQRR
ncbi:MAG: HAD family phosphatase [Verrucomicrobia bacterium]|nr:HAD family phosphatase [Verrucomicrobiota bacterium]